MNYANPILICDENEEFRILIRDMLTKNGFFHILEATNANEALEILKDRKDYLLLIEAKVLNEKLTSAVQNKKNFIIFADHSESSILKLASKLGVEHIMSYPVHSKKLLEKINSLS
ncbi:hypothetical protein [Peredibacter starrii]|uniref:Response regulatory domain-containing protein n=1 Tax=Peredibacter starrii TaxID=28202 RepID=A0AAX4HSL8_9BACT|nr:hypothetical protein [Peredibacter starrii]WPU66284.1 hypothetical protein SOO65_05945 [Peredibacter starrii]